MSNLFETNPAGPDLCPSFSPFPTLPMLIMQPQIQEMMHKGEMDENLYNDYLDLSLTLDQSTPRDNEVTYMYLKTACEVIRYWFIKHFSAHPKKKQHIVPRLIKLLHCVPSGKIQLKEEFRQLRIDILSELVTQLMLRDENKQAAIYSAELMNLYLMHTGELPEDFWSLAGHHLELAPYCATLKWQKVIYRFIPQYRVALQLGQAPLACCDLIVDGLKTTARTFLKRKQVTWATRFQKEARRFNIDPQ